MGTNSTSPNSGSASNPRPAGAAGSLQGTGQLILVADDEEPIRIISRRTLESFGYKVLLAADGESALRVYREQGAAIDLVITDLEMPGMDGRTMITELARLNPGVRVIAMSGYLPSVDEHGDNGLPPQVIGTLEKPYTASTLLTTLRTALAAP